MPNGRVSSAGHIPADEIECAALRVCEKRAKHDFNLVRRGLGIRRQILASSESDTHIASKALQTELRPFYRRGKPIVRLEPIAGRPGALGAFALRIELAESSFTF
jgi:hypothetical protein